MSSITTIKELLKTDDFQGKYKSYLSKKGKEDQLITFLDNIEINKKFYGLNIGYLKPIIFLFKLFPFILRRLF